jgi:hypothetical protein
MMLHDFAAAGVKIAEGGYLPGIGIGDSIGVRGVWARSSSNDISGDSSRAWRISSAWVRWASERGGICRVGWVFSRVFIGFRSVQSRLFRRRWRGVSFRDDTVFFGIPDGAR